MKSYDPKNIFTLNGKVALVTGAAGGIGVYVARRLAAAGARVALTDISESGLQKAKQTPELAQAEYMVADLQKANTPARLVDWVIAQHGRIDILVNVAAVNSRMPTIDVDERTYDRIMAINIKAPFFLSQVVVRHMHQGGSIIHIGSINSFQGLAEVGVYGPAKAALAQLTKVQAIEWADLEIRVNCIGPGFIDTPLTKPLQADTHRAGWITSRVPLKRFGKPDELIGMVQLLASEAGSFITGQTIYVDGGFTAGSDWRQA